MFAALLLVFFPFPLSGQTPQERIDASSPGDTVILGKDRYSDTLLIDKPITLTGDTTPPVIDGEGAPRVIQVEADSVVLRNLKVIGDAGRLNRDDAAVFLKESRNVTVENLVVDARGFGIYVYSGGGHRIVSNRVIGARDLRPSNRGNGIHLWKTTDNRVEHNRIRRVRDGLYLSFAHDNHIRSNRATSLRYGIHYMYSERNELRDNVMRDNVGGIALMYSRNNRVHGNRTVDNEDFGIQLLQLEESTFESNRVVGNRRGFFIENSVGDTLVRNRVRRNHVGLYLSAGSARNVLAHNVFRDNDAAANLKQSRDNRWSHRGRGNYWDGYPGLDRDGDGIGDEPHRLTGLRDRLVSHHPRAVMFLQSPLYRLAGYFNRLMPSQDDGKYDPHPLMEPPKDDAL